MNFNWIQIKKLESDLYVLTKEVVDAPQSYHRRISASLVLAREKEAFHLIYKKQR